MRRYFRNAEQMRQHYDDVGARLINPPRRVRDDGIDLRRPRKGFAPVGRRDIDEERERKIHAFIESCFAVAAQQQIEVEPAEVRRPTVQEIKRAVCSHFKIKMVELESARRHLLITRPRQIAMYLAKTTTIQSYPYIAKQLGGRDHTTAMHAVRRIEALMAIDPELRAHVEALAQQVGGSL